jgi:hypothetical protein
MRRSNVFYVSLTPLSRIFLSSPGQEIPSLYGTWIFIIQLLPVPYNFLTFITEYSAHTNFFHACHLPLESLSIFLFAASVQIVSLLKEKCGQLTSVTRSMENRPTETGSLVAKAVRWAQPKLCSRPMSYCNFHNDITDLREGDRFRRIRPGGASHTLALRDLI